MNPKPGPLHAYLKQLRSECPSIDASAIEAFGVPTNVVLDAAGDTENAEAFLEVMKGCLGQLDASKQILVRHYLFTRGDSGKREQAALEELKKADMTSSQSHYKNYLRKALISYVDALNRELSNIQDRPHDGVPAPPLTPTWYDVLEIEWFLRLEREDYKRQHWKRGIKIRSRTVDQPLIFLPQNWSGKGNRDGNVSILSGPKDGPHSHQCLRVRPESNDPNSWDLYIFDLGEPLRPGKEETLQFSEILVDDEDCFSPYIWQSTARYPMLERISFILDIPTELGVDMLEAYREVPTPHTGMGYAPVPPTVQVERDTDGLFRHIVTDIDHQSRHRVAWEPKYRKL